MSERPGIEDADHVALAYSWLSAHPKVLAAFGGPEHVSGTREDPWPHLEVEAGQGGLPPDFDTDVVESEVQLTVWAHPDGSTGDYEARRLLLVAVRALCEVRTAPYDDPTRPVVIRARPSGDLVPQNLANGQVRWQAGVILKLRPPEAPLAP